MSDATPREADVHVWERFALWDWLFAGTLAVSAVAALARLDEPVVERLGTVALAAALAAAYGLVWSRRDRLTEGAWPYLLYYLAAIALAAVLMSREPMAFLLFFGLYPQAFLLLGRWWPAGVVLLATTPFLRDKGLAGLTEPGNVASLLGNLALATVLGVFINRIADQSEQRRETLDALERTRAELAASERTAGVLSERQRLAREIHDTLAQGFTSIVMQLEAAEQALGDAAPPAAQRHLDAARRTARRSLVEVRRSVEALRPSPLDGASLVEGIAAVAREEAGAIGVPVAVHTTGDPVPLAPEVEVALVRSAQEALANARRHAAARRIDVTVSYMGDLVTLDVRDDGRGFAPGVRPAPPAGDAGGGYGLVAMRERLVALGGDLAVESAPGAGTSIAASIPVPRPSTVPARTTAPESAAAADRAAEPAP